MEPEPQDPPTSTRGSSPTPGPSPVKPPPPILDRTLRRSDSINELAAALAVAQGEMEPAKKDSVNPFFSTATHKSMYASLSSVWKACRKQLAKNGLAIVQASRVVVKNAVDVETLLMHSSGQWIAETLRVPAVQVDKYGNEKFDAQTIKTGSTYARRVQMEGFSGVAPEEDDDANSIAEEMAVPPVAEPPISNTPAGLNAADEGKLRALAESLQKDITSITLMNTIALKQFYEFPKGEFKSRAWKELQGFAHQQGWKWNQKATPQGGLFVEGTRTAPAREREEEAF